MSAAPGRATIQRVLPPKEWKEKQIRNLRATGEANYKVGISYPKADPIQEAIKAKEVWFNQLKIAYDEGHFENALKASSIDEWFRYAMEIGAGRLVDGVTKREAEVVKFVEGFQPLLESHLAKIDAMPKTTLQERIQRAIANIEGLHALKGKWR